MGKKWVNLVNLSIITHTASYLAGVFGSPITKSIEILSHFYLGISKGYSAPNSFWWSIFTFWQIKHLFTNSAISDFILGYQNISLRSWYILLIPGCIIKLLLWASSKILPLRPSTTSTHNLPWYFHNPLLSWVNPINLLDCIKAMVFWNSRSWCWANVIYSLKSLVILIWLS